MTTMVCNSGDTKITDTGLRYIPLRTPGGELISQSGLFVRIHKETVLNGSHYYNRDKSQGGPIPILITDTDQRS